MATELDSKQKKALFPVSMSKKTVKADIAQYGGCKNCVTTLQHQTGNGCKKKFNFSTRDPDHLHACAHARMAQFFLKIDFFYNTWRQDYKSKWNLVTVYIPDYGSWSPPYILIYAKRACFETSTLLTVIYRKYSTTLVLLTQGHILNKFFGWNHSP